MTDAQIQALLYESPKEGHTALFRAYYGLVYTIVQGRLSGIARPEDVEECVSDVFAEAFLQLGEGYAYDGSLKGFLRMIAVRRSIDTYRHLHTQAGMTVSIGDAPVLLSEDDPAADAERTEQSRMLLECIEALGEPDATIILQKYYFGATSREIAKGLSITPSAVRKRCSKALDRLRERLKALGMDTMEGTL